MIPPPLLTSSANTSVSFLHLSASVEKGPVSEIVVPRRIGSLQDPSFAAAVPAWAATPRTSAPMIAIRKDRIMSPPVFAARHPPRYVKEAWQTAHWTSSKGLPQWESGLT